MCDNDTVYRARLPADPHVRSDHGDRGAFLAGPSTGVGNLQLPVADVDIPTARFVDEICCRRLPEHHRVAGFAASYKQTKIAEHLNYGMYGCDDPTVD